MKNASPRKTLRLSYTNKPDDMTLEQWQIALRKQAAMKEQFGIAEMQNNEETGYYSVRNPQTHNMYKVIYRGPESKWNYCSCMDFKSNQLGTCKHLEAVKLWIQGRHKAYVNKLPAFTSVYLQYKGGRRVRIRIGSEKETEFKLLAQEYFNSNNELKPECIDTFSSFLNRAHAISDTFRCYSDVLQFIIDVRDKDRCRQLADTACDDDGLKDILHTTLYPFQKEAVRFAVRSGKCIIADEMGLGKTIEALATAEIFKRAGIISSALILCPTSLKYQWKKEIERFTDSSVLVIEGNQLHRKQQHASHEFYKIISYNSVSNDIRLLGSLHSDMLIMDEAQRLKNWKTQISMSVRRIESDYTIVLSGTPLENKLLELYSIVQFVDQYRLGPLYKFVDNTTILSDTGQVIGYKNLNEVGEMLSGILLRRRKKDVLLQLPERTDKILYVPMESEQRKIHDEYKSVVSQIVYKWHKMHFLSENDRKRLLLSLNSMRMVCDSTYILDQKTRHDTKIEELMNIIDDVIESGTEKIVVFSQWERMTYLVCQELDKRNVVYANLNGSIPSLKRKELIDEFTDNPSCRVFVSTDAGCNGLNLQIASLVINMDLPWNPAILEQRISRIYRIGQKQNIQVVNFVAENTIEEKILSTLNFKSNLAGGILDAGEDSVFLEASKFGKLMETVSDVIEEERNEKVSYEVKEEEFEKASQPDSIQLVIDFTEDGDKTIIEKEDDTHKAVMKVQKEETKPNVYHDLINQGVSFISLLADTLSSPEKIDNFVNSIVKEDRETGKTLVEIPVSDKESVKKVMNMISQLLKKT
jgi:SNF2 family DNA or RNA helicase